MFVRKKKQRSGTFSVQIIDKSSGKSRVIKTIGSSKDPDAVELLMAEGRRWIAGYGGQMVMGLMPEEDRGLRKQLRRAVRKVQLLGPELVLGQLFDEVGFNQLKEDLFRHLVLSRLVYPGSKLRTVDYLARYWGVVIGVDKVYRYLDKLHTSQMAKAQDICFRHSEMVLGGQVGMMFYDVTTLYFEAEREDDFRRVGYSKDGKHARPQILLGLLVGLHGYPLAYDLFEGNKFEGHTLIPVIEAFKKRYRPEKLVIIADSGLLSNKNVRALIKEGYEFILGARIKNESDELRRRITSLQLEDGESSLLTRPDGLKLVISYSEKRARKDAHNRTRGLEKLEKAYKAGKLTKAQVNNRGYNKYLRLDGEVKVEIDRDRFEQDAKWDGLKGFLTNSGLSKEEVTGNYRHLWQIERAFRISKTDLRFRPIFHRLKRRIEAHICIAFCAYKIYKELERQVKEEDLGLSAEKVIEILKTIYGLEVVWPKSQMKETMLMVADEDQARILEAFGIDWKADF